MDAGIQSLRTVTCRLHKCLIQVSCQPLGSHPYDWIPAVHAGMTGLLHLCITARAGAWERANMKTLYMKFTISSELNFIISMRRIRQRADRQEKPCQGILQALAA